jgi:hypothetical protein
MNKFFVRLTGAAAPLWARLGADPRALQLILDAKLKISERNPVVMGQQQQKGNSYAWLIYFFLGLFGLAFVGLYFAIDHRATAVGLALTLSSVYLCLMLVMEMSENMFDHRDLTVLLSRPINDRTFSLSRALHILVFAAKFSALLLLPLALGLIVSGSLLLAVLYLLLAVMSTLLSVLLTLSVYLTLLRRVPTERLQKVLSWVQMVLTTVFFFAYQLPNLFNFLGFSADGIRITGSWWGFSWPGFWLSGWYGLAAGDGNLLMLVQGLLGLVATVGGVAYYLSQGQGYGEQLMALRVAGSQSRAEVQQQQSVTDRYRQTYRDWFALTFTRPGVERASLHFNWALMSRDLKYKQQVYPMLVVLPVMIVAIGGSALFTEADALTGGSVVAVLYSFALLIVSPLTASRTSDDFRAAWVFSSNPLDDTKPVRYGQLLAALGQFLLPSALILYLLIVAVAGPEVVDDILLSAAAVLMSAAIYQQLDDTLPFSVERSAGSYTALGPMMAVFFVAGLAGLGHYLLTFVPYAIPVAAAVAWGLCWLTVRGLRESA